MHRLCAGKQYPGTFDSSDPAEFTEDLAEAKAKRVPSLDFSTSQNYVNQKSEKTDGNFEANGTYSGNYALKPASPSTTGAS